jgi:hypothetical protein
MDCVTGRRGSNGPMTKGPGYPGPLSKRCFLGYDLVGHMNVLQFALKVLALSPMNSVAE